MMYDIHCTGVRLYYVHCAWVRMYDIHYTGVRLYYVHCEWVRMYDIHYTGARLYYVHCTEVRPAHTSSCCSYTMYRSEASTH